MYTGGVQVFISYRCRHCACCIYIHVFLRPATTPVVPALKNSYTVPHLYLQPACMAYSTAARLLPGYRAIPIVRVQ